MPSLKSKHLSLLFRSAVKITPKAIKATSIVGDAPVKPAVNKELTRFSIKSSRCAPHPTVAVDYIFNNFNDGAEESPQHISTILCGSKEFDMYDSSDFDEADGYDSSESDSEVPWSSNLFNSSTPLRRKELSRDRKNKWVFKLTQKLCFDKLVSMCLVRLGSGSMFEVLTKLGRGMGVNEYNAFVRGCIETARNRKDEKTQVEQILEAYRLLRSMKEQGFPIEEEAFGPFFIYLIDKHMEEHFRLLLEIVKDEDPSLHPRLGYYEMLFWIEMNNEEKIQEICKHIASSEREMSSLLYENYLLALCEKDRKELLQLFDVIDITRISSMDNVAIIFRSIGRLSLEAVAELFILLLKDCDYGPQNISNLIYAYASSLKNLAVEDAILKFREMHEKLNISLVAESYEKLITFCCNSFKVHLALDLVDEMCEAGLTLSVETLNAICYACEESCEFILARRIYSMLGCYKLKPDCETFRSIINMSVKMDDFHNAFVMLKDFDRLNLRPSASLYNVILAGYYREKNMVGVRRVLEEMKEADVKPDSHTFSILINNSVHEEEIDKYYEELKLAGVQASKHVFSALVNAYASSGQFEKAKEVLHDKEIPVNYLTEIKSALVSALALHGQMADAFEIYEDMKQSGSCLEPKAVRTLIEYLRPEGQLDLQLCLLEEINDSHYWVNGCYRVILCCIKEKNLRSAVDLLKKLVYKFQDDELAQEFIFDEVFSQIADTKPPDLQIGIDLLTAIKELGHRPSRKCLDFLLSACVLGEDLQKAQLVWKEYETAGFHHNILSLLRMYQAYLASRHYEEAADFLCRIPQDDPHVRSVIYQCQVSYGNPKKTTKNKGSENIVVEQEGV